jgi:hypothetical protein
MTHVKQLRGCDRFCKTAAALAAPDCSGKPAGCLCQVKDCHSRPKRRDRNDGSEDPPLRAGVFTPQ